ncbi:alpha/beta hydrolase, partial [Pseudonocardia zijingensis]|uniref:alpha/beta hydrolase n=1 Tax=Pseudonocardia zijingensis TaxID=153376 RepID=UPI0031DFA5D1
MKPESNAQYFRHHHDLEPIFMRIRDEVGADALANVRYRVLETRLADAQRDVQQWVFNEWSDPTSRKQWNALFDALKLSPERRRHTQDWFADRELTPTAPGAGPDYLLPDGTSVNGSPMLLGVDNRQVQSLVGWHNAVVPAVVEGRRLSVRLIISALRASWFDHKNARDDRRAAREARRAARAFELEAATHTGELGLLDAAGDPYTVQALISAGQTGAATTPAWARQVLELTQESELRRLDDTAERSRTRARLIRHTAIAAVVFAGVVAIGGWALWPVLTTTTAGYVAFAVRGAVNLHRGAYSQQMRVLVESILERGQFNVGTIQHLIKTMRDNAYFDRATPQQLDDFRRVVAESLREAVVLEEKQLEPDESVRSRFETALKEFSQFLDRDGNALGAQAQSFHALNPHSGLLGRLLNTALAATFVVNAFGHFHGVVTTDGFVMVVNAAFLLADLLFLGQAAPSAITGWAGWDVGAHPLIRKLVHQRALPMITVANVLLTVQFGFIDSSPMVIPAMALTFSSGYLTILGLISEGKLGRLAPRRGAIANGVLNASLMVFGVVTLLPGHGWHLLAAAAVALVVLRAAARFDTWRATRPRGGGPARLSHAGMNHPRSAIIRTPGRTVSADALAAFGDRVGVERDAFRVAGWPLLLVHVGLNRDVHTRTGVDDLVLYSDRNINVDARVWAVLRELAGTHPDVVRALLVHELTHLAHPRWTEEQVLAAAPLPRSWPTALQAAVTEAGRPYSLSVLFETIAQQPGISAVELARGSPHSGTALHRKLGWLTEAGLLVAHREGRTIVYHVPDGVLEMLAGQTARARAAWAVLEPWWSTDPGLSKSGATRRFADAVAEARRVSDGLLGELPAAPGTGADAHPHSVGAMLDAIGARPEGITLDELARTLGLPYQTVRDRMDRMVSTWGLVTVSRQGREKSRHALSPKAWELLADLVALGEISLGPRTAERLAGSGAVADPARRDEPAELGRALRVDLGGAPSASRAVTRALREPARPDVGEGPAPAPVPAPPAPARDEPRPGVPAGFDGVVAEWRFLRADGNGLTRLQRRARMARLSTALTGQLNQVPPADRAPLVAALQRLAPGIAELIGPLRPAADPKREPRRPRGPPPHAFALTRTGSPAVPGEPEAAVLAELREAGAISAAEADDLLVASPSGRWSEAEMSLRLVDGLHERLTEAGSDLLVVYLVDVSTREVFADRAFFEDWLRSTSETTRRFLEDHELAHVVHADPSHRERDVWGDYPRPVRRELAAMARDVAGGRPWWQRTAVNAAGALRRVALLEPERPGSLRVLLDEVAAHPGSTADEFDVGLSARDTRTWLRALAESGLVQVDDRARRQRFSISEEGAALLSRLDRRGAEVDPARRRQLHRVADLLDAPPVRGPRRLTDQLRPLLAAVGTSQAATARWWRGLSQVSQIEEPTRRPELGNMDGIPAIDRHRINVQALRNDQQLLEQQLELLQSGLLTLLGVRREQMVLRAKLAGIRTLLAELEADASLLLLTYDISKVRGQAAISVGNPDTADHVAVFVPGMRYRFSRIEVPLDRARAMRRAAVEAGADSTAVIAWGHLQDWPQTIPNAGSEAPARTAAPLLHSFLEGLHATHRGALPHLTLVAHSYGSVLAGVTAADYGLPIDDLVLLGSPGTTLDSAAQFHLAAGRVWAGTATRDPILTTPRRWHNLLPTDPRFGATVFDAGTGGTYGLIGPHASYWQDDSPARVNTGRIIAGERDLVTLAPGRRVDGTGGSGGTVAVDPFGRARRAMSGALAALHDAAVPLDPQRYPHLPRAPPGVTVMAVPAELRPAGAENVVAFGWAAHGGVVLVFEDVLAEVDGHIAAGRLTAGWWTRVLAHEHGFHLAGDRHTGLRHGLHAARLAGGLAVARFRVWVAGRASVLRAAVAVTGVAVVTVLGLGLPATAAAADPGPPAARVSVSATPQQAAHGRDVVSQPGDSVTRLARGLGTTPAAVRAAVQVRNPDLALPADDVPLPVGTKFAAPSGTGTTWVVQPSSPGGYADSLSRVADRFDLADWTDVADANRRELAGRNPNLIFPDETFTVPAGEREPGDGGKPGKEEKPTPTKPTPTEPTPTEPTPTEPTPTKPAPTTPAPTTPVPTTPAPTTPAPSSPAPTTPVPGTATPSPSSPAPSSSSPPTATPGTPAPSTSKPGPSRAPPAKDLRMTGWGVVLLLSIAAVFAASALIWLARKIRAALKAARRAPVPTRRWVVLERLLAALGTPDGRVAVEELVAAEARARQGAGTATPDAARDAARARVDRLAGDVLTDAARLGVTDRALARALRIPVGAAAMLLAPARAIWGSAPDLDGRWQILVTRRARLAAADEAIEELLATGVRWLLNPADGAAVPTDALEQIATALDVPVALVWSWALAEGLVDVPAAVGASVGLRIDRFGGFETRLRLVAAALDDLVAGRQQERAAVERAHEAFDRATGRMLSGGAPVRGGPAAELAGRAPVPSP